MMDRAIRDKISRARRRENVKQKRRLVTLDSGETRTHSCVHNAINRRFKKPRCCWACGKEAKLDWAKKPGLLYSWEIYPYLPLCRSCHRTLDKRGVDPFTGEKVAEVC